MSCVWIIPFLQAVQAFEAFKVRSDEDMTPRIIAPRSRVLHAVACFNAKILTLAGWFEGSLMKL